MKQRTLWIGLLALYLPGAGAVDFNTDALKSMQEEGHKIVEESQSLRSFKLSSGLCLHANGQAGANLVVNKCDPKANNQKWRFDDKGRLASQGGACVGVAGDASKPGASAVMQKCSGAKFQQWKQDGKKRLVNGLDKCLEAAGDARSPGSNVTTAVCSDSPKQVWN